GSAFALLLVGDQPYLVHPERPDLIDDVDHFSVADANTALNVDDLIFFLLDVGQELLNLVLDLVLLDLVFSKVIAAILRDGNHDRVVLDDSLVFFRVVHVLRQVYRDAVLQHGSNNHKNDQEHQHDVDHRGDINI